MEYSFTTSCKKLMCFLYSNDLFQEGALQTKNTKSPLSYTRLRTLIFGFFFLSSHHQFPYGSNKYGYYRILVLSLFLFFCQKLCFVTYLKIKKLLFLGSVTLLVLIYLPISQFYNINFFLTSINLEAKKDFSPCQEENSGHAACCCILLSNSIVTRGLGRAIFKFISAITFYWNTP